MADSPNGNENSSNDAERSRRAFGLYLRTGQRGNDLEPPAETKYNPWHDPDDGRFTHAGSGHHFGRGGGRAPDAGRVARGPSKLPMPEAPRPPRLGNRPPARMVRPLELPASSLSRTHRAFLSRAREFPAKPGTQDVWRYTGRDGSLPKDKFKDQYISGHSNVFKAAAKEFDLPVELVASVAHAELGNDNVRNDIGYALRAEEGRNLPRVVPMAEDFNKRRAETSFGPYNIQERRAAEILGYGDINKMSKTARRTLVPTTRDPVAATFMLAKHLSDLRNLDFPGVAGKDLTRDQLLIVASRYRSGPDVSGADVRRKIESGKDYLSSWNRVKLLIGK